MLTIDECYRTLGISRNASQEEIKSAYQRLIRQWHPDINKNPGATEKAKKINEAYETLIKYQTESNIIYPEGFWTDFFGRPTLFDKNPFVNFNFNSKVTRSSVTLEVDESNNEDLDLIPEILRKAGFIIRSFTITKYH